MFLMTMGAKSQGGKKWILSLPLLINQVLYNFKRAEKVKGLKKSKPLKTRGGDVDLGSAFLPQSPLEREWGLQRSDAGQAPYPEKPEIRQIVTNNLLVGIRGEGDSMSPSIELTAENPIRKPKGKSFDRPVDSTLVPLATD